MAGSAVIPGMQYEHAAEALEWLCAVFGFEKRAVYPGENGTIMHAELTLGGGMIMLGSVKKNDHSKLMRLPGEIGGGETRSVYLVVDDADAVCARAKAGGAEIVFDIEDKPYGGRGFTCSDPWGHVWDVGTYDPWAQR